MAAPHAAQPTDRAGLRRLLLHLMAPDSYSATDRLAALPEHDRQALAEMAAQHRLEPLLHSLHHASPALPADLAQAWRAAHRVATMAAMAQAQELRATAALLADAGIEAIALKGAWLAFHAYPDPAMRPMRDIDLLLRADQVGAAHALLCAKGYDSPFESEFVLEDMMRLEKHLPPLVSPRGIVLELHHRLWGVDGHMDHAAPTASAAEGPASRAITIDGQAYFAPHDCLAHLIIHAVYDHRLDCGPLLLTDIGYLLRTSPIDWAAFWAEAHGGNWERGARLVLDLVHRHDPALAIDFAGAGPRTPDAVLQSAPDLFLQDMDTRRSASVVATAWAGGAKALWQRLTARRSEDRNAAPVVRDLSAEGGFAAWAKSRMGRTLRELARPDVRRQARNLARLSAWLDK